MTTKSIFITGGTTGLGLELAKIYHSFKWNVAVCGRDKAKFDAAGVEFDFYQADVSNSEEIANAINDFHIKTGRLDIVVANAGIAYSNKTKFPDMARSRKMLEINVMGVFNTFEPALKIMKDQGYGHVVGVSSVAGFNGLPGVSYYAASKGFVKNLMESFNLDLEEFGIHSTCIIPGFIDTPLTQVNPHPMPFMISAPEAARKVYDGLERHQAIITFPYFWFFITRLLSLLPRFIYRFIMGIKVFNFSKE
jgi:NAD(P)-dependent dehydrogenase (short-subunit alcohol dehydrogenase family)